MAYQDQVHVDRNEANRRKLLFRQVSRRAFLGKVGLFTASAAAVETLRPVVLKTQAGSAAAYVAPYSGRGFPARAFQVRVSCAEATRGAIPAHPTNGDEAKYANKIATDTRGLPHNQLGEVDLKAHQTYINALKSGDFNDFEAIKLGGKRKLLQPLAPLAVSLTGLNASQIELPVPPTLDSAITSQKRRQAARQHLDLFERLTGRSTMCIVAYDQKPTLD